MTKIIFLKKNYPMLLTEIILAYLSEKFIYRLVKYIFSIQIEFKIL